jgi:hypothetical protein
MSDLVKKLNDKSFWYTPHIADGRPMRHKIAAEAADKIEEKDKRIAELEKINYNLTRDNIEQANSMTVTDKAYSTQPQPKLAAVEEGTSPIGGKA